MRSRSGATGRAVCAPPSTLVFPGVFVVQLVRIPAAQLVRDRAFPVRSHGNKHPSRRTPRQPAHSQCVQAASTWSRS